MSSPADRLAQAIEAWRSHLARERVGRWRGDPDALPGSEVHARHARLRSAQSRDLLAEAVDRGDTPPDELAALAEALEQARAAPAGAEAVRREREIWAARAPFDSDHFEASTLLGRLRVDPSPKRRRALGAALQPTFAELAARREEVAAARPKPSGDDVERAELALTQTEDAWMEVSARIAHAAGSPLESWTDLAYILRAARWDDAVRPSARWRRLAERLGALAFTGTLARCVKVEARRAQPYETRARLALIAVPRDIRIGPGVERGAASERDAAAALGHAAAIALTHPATPTILRRRGAGVGEAVGALLAHVIGDPRFLSRAGELNAREARQLSEVLLGLELVDLRTAAAAVALSAHAGEVGLDERAQATLRGAWSVDDVPRALALGLGLGPGAAERLRATVAAPRLFVAMRERFDADFWRNPAAAEPIRAGAARGGAASYAAWAEELGVEPIPLDARYAELL